jgi:ParB/RepB/Spo0J family partition protein
MATVTITGSPAKRRRGKLQPSSNGNGKPPCDCVACKALAKGDFDTATHVCQKPPVSTNGNGNGKAKVKPKPTPATDVPAGRLTKVPIASIDPSTFNPRIEFDPNKMEELTASIRMNGVLQALVVRKHPYPMAAAYEIVAGERRYRAAKLAGLTEVPVSICTLTDRQAREIAAIENLQRENLSPIEEARAYQSLLAGDDAPTQAELAARLGTSQGQISNRLRLLELPESVQRLVISGEIPATHARELCRYKDHADLVEKLAKEAVLRSKEDGLPPVEVFAENLAADICFDHGRRMRGESYDRKIGRSVPHFTPTAEEREQLQVIELPDLNGGKKTIEVALNKELWQKLQERHAAKWVSETPKGSPRKQAAKEKAKPAGEMTAAEKAAAAKAAAQAAKEREAQFARRLYLWRCDWQRWLIAEEIRKATDGELCAILLAAAYEWHPHAMSLPGAGSRRVWNAMQKSGDPGAFARQATAALFWNAKDVVPVGVVPNSDVEVIFDQFDLNLVHPWSNDQAGPLSEAYWTMHTKDQLVALARELKYELKGTTKSAMVAELLSQRPKPDDMNVTLELPKEIAKAKRPRGW